MEQDKDLLAVRKAHAQLRHDIGECLVDVAASSLQGAVSGTSRLWADLFNAYTLWICRHTQESSDSLVCSAPFRCFSSFIYLIHDSTEYVDENIEFVLEDLDIYSINLLPGQVFVRNITDFEDCHAHREEIDDESTTVGALKHVP